MTNPNFISWSVTGHSPVCSSSHRYSIPILFTLTLCMFLTGWGCTFTGNSPTRDADDKRALAKPESQQETALRGLPQMLPGDRIVIGTVKTILSEQIKVDDHESLQPRYLPLSIAREKGMELKPGDRVRMVFNEQHVLVDFHPLGHRTDHHSIIMGRIMQEVQAGQDDVVVKTEDGRTKSYLFRPLIRSKMSSVPTNVLAVFLVDETDHIVDVTFGDFAALKKIKMAYRQMATTQ